MKATAECGDSCMPEVDERLEREILRLLRARGPGKTICPSEAARAVAASDDRTAWEPLMPLVRAAAGRLVGAGKIDVLQAGRVLDASTAKGPVRLRSRQAT